MTASRSREPKPQDVFCSTKPSWQGDRCAPPLHPPGHGSHRALNLLRASRPYRRSNTRGRLRSPCTHRSKGVPALVKSRPTLRSLDAAILPKMDHSQGPIATPEPSLSDLENCLSTDTEPCTIALLIDARSRERSCFPQHPHDHFMETTSARPTFARWMALWKTRYLAKRLVHSLGQPASLHRKSVANMPSWKTVQMKT